MKEHGMKCIASGHSTVYSLASPDSLHAAGGLDGFVAVKVVPSGLERIPHDIRREIRLLEGCHHVNVLTRAPGSARCSMRD